MDDQQWIQLKNDIQEKCVAYEYVEQHDTSLSDFIINFIKVGSSMDAVNEELLAMIGDDYDQNITPWIFERMDELKNAQNGHDDVANGAVQPEQTDQPVEEQPVVQEQSEDARAEAQQALRDSHRRLTANRQHRMFASAMGGLGQRPSIPAHPQRQARLRSRSRSPPADPDRAYKHRRRSPSPTRHDQRDYRHEQPSSSIFSRLSDNADENERGSSVFDRLGIQKPPASAHDDNSPREQRFTPTRRCKYWPACNQGDQCTFAHPTTLCPDFPNCPKKDNECLFLHPAIRPGHMPQLAQQYQQPQSVPREPNGTERTIPCRFFPHCTNDNCPFFHPPVPAAPAVPTGPKRIPIPCNFGDKCLRPDCYYLHPKDNDNPADVVCRFDGACSRPNCFYKHPIQGKKMMQPHAAPHRSLVINQQHQQSSRLAAVADDTQVEKMIVGESADLIKQ
ncbi:hypothetical protein BC940DRAFT_337682 [Gongronella butleri]|nr:hypothetical protein BC940DRAFT_337682 [Gongronella butleri]